MTEKLYAAVSDLAALIEKHERAEWRIAELEAQVEILKKSFKEALEQPEINLVRLKETFREWCYEEALEKLKPGAMKCVEARPVLDAENLFLVDLGDVGTKVKLWCFYREES